MGAVATLNRVETGDVFPSPAVGPLVMIGGEPRADLWVRSLSMRGPLDVREAELVLVRDGAAVVMAERARLDRLLGAAVAILQPVALASGESRLLPLFHGRFKSAGQRLSGRGDELGRAAVCDWRRRLERPIERGDVTDESWTARTLIERLNALGGLGLSIDSLPPTIAGRVVVTPGAAATLGAVLESLLDQSGTAVQRRLEWDGHRVTERRTIRRVADGRPIGIGSMSAANPAGSLEHIAGDVPARRPVKLVAQADGQVVESTFALVGGWDPSLESLADAEYGKSTSGDFDAAANVFRLWVLNEDGTFSAPPFNRGSAFSLTALFGDGRAVPPQPLRFGGPLTQDDAGRSVGVIVDTSDDGGATWSRYPGPARLLTDRAGVYLDDDALPPAFLVAARLGLAAVRITATLRNPLPLETVRWDGNPFAGEFVTRTWKLGERFRHRVISGGSKFRAQIEAGQRTADTADDRAAMAAWLAEEAASIPAATAHVDVETTGVHVALRIGDRFAAFTGRDFGLGGEDPAAGNDTATLVEITHRWDEDRSRLRWEVNGA
jgi:hypothetical protein